MNGAGVELEGENRARVDEEVVDCDERPEAAVVVEPEGARESRRAGTAVVAESDAG